MVSILHLLAHLVSYIIMIFVSIASIAGTAFLWYTYYDLKHNVNQSSSRLIILSETLKNETAFLWYSIIATIITVRNQPLVQSKHPTILFQVVILLLVIVMRKQVDFLADLFKETSKSLLHIPGLFLQPLITFVFLFAFFAFWVVVVVSGWLYKHIICAIIRNFHCSYVWLLLIIRLQIICPHQKILNYHPISMRCKLITAKLGEFLWPILKVSKILNYYHICMKTWLLDVIVKMKRKKEVLYRFNR